MKSSQHANSIQPILRIFFKIILLSAKDFLRAQKLIGLQIMTFTKLRVELAKIIKTNLLLRIFFQPIT